MTTPARSRRWFRFSLRGLLVVTTLLGAWLGYELRWIRQRHDAKAWIEGKARSWAELPVDQSIRCRVVHAPWHLSMFGERGVDRVGVVVQPMEVSSMRQKLEHLFPEAEVIVVPTGARTPRRIR